MKYEAAKFKVVYERNEVIRPVQSKIGLRSFCEQCIHYVIVVYL